MEAWFFVHEAKVKVTTQEFRDWDSYARDDEESGVSDRKEEIDRIMVQFLIIDSQIHMPVLFTLAWISLVPNRNGPYDKTPTISGSSFSFNTFCNFQHSEQKPRFSLQVFGLPLDCNEK